MSYDEVDVSEQQNTAVRAGVRHLEVEEAQDGQRLDNFIQRVLGEVPRSRVYRIIRKGEVRVKEEAASPELREVKPGHWVATWNAPGYATAKMTEPRVAFRRPAAAAVVTAV